MGYEILPHTADIGIAATGRDPAEAFSEAARATGAVILDAEPPEPDGSEPVDVEGDDLAALLAAFLEECLYFFETRGELPAGARLQIEDGRARGEVLTCRGLEPAGPQIKAVTYHQLRVEPAETGWRAEAYFDV